MKKNVMRPLTEAEMQTVNGGGLFGKLFGSILAALLGLILPDGKYKETAIGVTEAVVNIVV